ncbi:hypothetical protein BSR03_07095 [Serratia proteamaculans]|nr:hypothetical protein BSR03_07095 [Serratia proteamaculans]
MASGAAPYLAREIKARIGDDNVAANAMAHAMLGAIAAQLNNPEVNWSGVRRPVQVQPNAANGIVGAVASQ